MLVPIADLSLLDPDGRLVSLADFGDGTLVIQLVRYFGCLPCQLYLRDLDRNAPALAERGARAIAVGGSTEFQARWLRETGVTMPLLLDPEQRVRDSLGLGSLTLRQLLAPRGMRNYVAARFRGARFWGMSGATRESPGIAVLAAGFDVRWTHEGAALGDYPPIGEVLRQVERVRDARLAA